MVRCQVTAQIKRALNAIVRAGLDFDLIHRINARLLGDEVDDAARARLAVENRRRAAQHFHALQQIGIRLWVAVFA